MGSRIAYVTGFNPSLNPRLAKSADVVSRLGHDVDVYFPIVNAGRAAEDFEIAENAGWSARPYFDWRRPGQRFSARMVRRFGSAMCQLGRDSFMALGYGLLTGLLPKLSALRKYDLVICHQEVGLWVAARLRQATRTWVDLEDWYSRDLLPEAHRGRPVGLLDRLERHALTNATVCSTTTHAMAKAMHEVYGGELPEVVYNSFPRAKGPEGEATDHQGAVRFHWFSQTIGPGRGLETVADAMNLVDGDYEVHLRGHCADMEWLTCRLTDAARSRLFVHAPVSNADLPARVAEFDCGLALEDATPQSRDLTGTNKIFYYLVNGLQVIATPTTGQIEILESCADSGHYLVSFNDCQSLANAMRLVIQRHDRNRRRIGVSNELSWDHQAREIHRIVSDALGPHRK